LTGEVQNFEVGRVFGRYWVDIKYVPAQREKDHFAADVGNADAGRGGDLLLSRCKVKGKAGGAQEPLLRP